MIALAWTLGSIVAYLAIGAGIAKWDLPHLHQRLADNSFYDGWRQEAVAARGWSIATMLLWPFRGLCLVAIRIADKTNPVLVDREIERHRAAIEKREREIKAFERELLSRDDR